MIFGEWWMMLDWKPYGFAIFIYVFFICLMIVGWWMGRKLDKMDISPW